MAHVVGVEVASHAVLQAIAHAESQLRQEAEVGLCRELVLQILQRILADDAFGQVFALVEPGVAQREAIEEVLTRQQLPHVRL